MSEITAIILAAGVGKRMRSSLPKVLHPFCGRPMIDYSLEAAQESGARRLFVVTSKGKKNRVTGYLKKNAKTKMVTQSPPLGTGHAVLSCAAVLKKYSKAWTLILCGDVPLIQSATLKKFLKTVQESKATLGFITTELDSPFGYGRVVRNGTGEVIRVVEEKEATEEEKSIREINTGIFAAESGWLLNAVKKLKPHPVTKEYYLTDIVEEAIQEGEKLVGFKESDSDDFLGINTHKQLALAEEVMRSRLVEYWMAKGVTFTDPRHVYLDSSVTIGADTVIEPLCFLKGKTRIGKNCVIESGCMLNNMVVGDGVHLKAYSVLEESVIEKKAQVGPFARLRPHSHVGQGARVGNFVELKKTKLGEGVKANHLSYLGDADIGAETNVGCGTITCNYDGVKKHPTKIGKKVFIGSDVQFVAPVKIGDGATIGAGSTITQNVPAKALAIARGRQVVKRGWTRKISNIKNQKSKT